MSETDAGAVPTVSTGIAGLDRLTLGGVPEGRTTLLTGTTGSGKTILSTQFLARGIEELGAPAVFVTFEESPGDIRCNVASFGWPIERWEREGRWTFVDVSPEVTQAPVEAGEYDLGALISRINGAIERVGARRVAVDSLGAVSNLLGNTDLFRQEVHRLVAVLKEHGTTAVLTAERTEEGGGLARFGVEEFVTDNVIVLRNERDGERRRRSIEILKMRGTEHRMGQYPMTITADRGIVIQPLEGDPEPVDLSDERMGTGVPTLDGMCGGGFHRGALVLASGPTGTGKTLLANHFIQQGVRAGDRTMVFAFEETREEFLRNARGWGFGLREALEEERLNIHFEYPEATGLEKRFVRMKQTIESFRPDRLVIDSFSALQRFASSQRFREFVLRLGSYLKNQRITTLATVSSPTVFGGEVVTEANFSTLTDGILVLRYVEQFGTVQRGIMVLKMRGTDHEQYIRRFSIDDAGMRIHEPFSNVSGVLSGSTTYRPGEEVAELSQQAREQSDRDRETGHDPD